MYEEEEQDVRPGAELGDIFDGAKWRLSPYVRMLPCPQGELRLRNMASGAVVTLSESEASALRPALLFGAAEQPLPAVGEELIAGEFLVPIEIDSPAVAMARYIRFSTRPETSVAILTSVRSARRVAPIEPWVLDALTEWVKRTADEGRGISVSWLGDNPFKSSRSISWASARWRHACDERGVKFAAGVRGPVRSCSRGALADLAHGGVERFELMVRPPFERAAELVAVLLGGQERSLAVTLSVFGDDAARCGGDLAALVAGLPDGVAVRTVPRPRRRAAQGRGALCGGCTATATVLAQGGDSDRIRLGGFAQPFGSMCHAADANTFVVGPSGLLHKCTVALDEPMNVVGSLQANGVVAMMDDRLAAWTQPWGLHQRECRRCHFLLACYGNACPLHRIMSGQRPCPDLKDAVDHLDETPNSPTLSVPCDPLAGCRTVPGHYLRQTPTRRWNGGY